MEVEAGPNIRSTLADSACSALECGELGSQIHILDDCDDKPSPSTHVDPVDQVIYLSIVKRLLGEEMRSVIRQELRAALSISPATPKGSEKLPPAVHDEPGGQTGDESSRTLTRAQSTRSVKRMNSMAMDSTGLVGMARRGSTALDEVDKEAAQNIESEDPFEAWHPHSRSMIRRASECFGNVGTIEATNQPKLLKHVIESFAFGSLVNLVILLNCAFMVYSLNYQVENYMEEETVETAFFWCDVCFLFFYTIELLLKLTTYRMYFFFDINWKSNWFDFVLLLASMQSVAFTVFLSGNRVIQNLGGLRILKLLRLLKALRVLRLALYFHTLRAILLSMLNSFWTLLWSLCTLAVVYFVFSLLFVSRIATHLSSEGQNLDQGEIDIYLARYGSVAIAMERLVMVTAGGMDWGADYILMGSTGAISQIAFLFFVFFIQVALLNIILGIFVDDAMKSLQPDDYQKAHELALEDKRLHNELTKLCAEVDINHSGFLNEDEWRQIMCNKNKRELIEMMGLPAHHVHQYFHLMCASSMSSRGLAHVDIAEFIKGCMRLRGSASPFDIISLSLELAELKDLMLKEFTLLSQTHHAST